jgi:hypothetical protein
VVLLVGLWQPLQCCLVGLPLPQLVQVLLLLLLLLFLLMLLLFLLMLLLFLLMVLLLQQLGQL